MARMLLFFVSIFFCTHGLAQSAPPAAPSQEGPPALTADELDNKLGKDWKGILYVCNPFCEFISVRENKIWNPNLPKINPKWENIKTISQTDPLYPLLVMRDPVLPFMMKKAKTADNSKNKTLEEPPKYAALDFNWGFAFSGGMEFSQSNWGGNTVLQQDLSSEGIQYTPTGLVQVMKGQPTKLWKWWVLHQLDLQFSLSPNYKSKEETLHIQHQETSFMYQMWFPSKNFKIGPRLAYNTEQWSVPTNSLQHFSFDRKSWLGGVSLLWKHWLFAFDTSLISQISEQQNFRQEPFTLNWYRLKAQKCSADITLFDISFGLCGGATVLLDQQSAAFADNILIPGKSNLNRTDLGAYFLIRIGEDLYQ